MLAECGGGGELAIPVVVGYVEPNQTFWKKLKELIARHRQLLKETDFDDEDLIRKPASLKNRWTSASE